MTSRILDERPGRTLTVLHNGVRVASWREQANNGIATVGIGFDRGCDSDPPGQTGLTHFLEHVLLPKDKEAPLTRNGGFVNAVTGNSGLLFFAGSFADKMAQNFQALTTAVSRPAFDHNVLEIERKRILREIVESGYISNARAIELSSHGASPSLHPVLGNEALVASFSRNQVQQHWQRLLKPENLIVIASGDVDHKHLENLAEKHLGNLQRSPAEAKPQNMPFRADILVTPGTQPTFSACTLFQLPEQGFHPATSTVIGHLLGENTDLAIHNKLSWGQALTYYPICRIQNIHRRPYLLIDCLIEATMAKQAGTTLASDIRNLASRIQEQHLTETRLQLHFGALSERFGSHDTLFHLVSSASEMKCPVTALEKFNELGMPSLDEVRSAAQFAFQQPPAIAVTSRAGIPFVTALRPDYSPAAAPPPRQANRLQRILRGLSHACGF